VLCVFLLKYRGLPLGKFVFFLQLQLRLNKGSFSHDPHDTCKLLDGEDPERFAYLSARSSGILVRI